MLMVLATATMLAVPAKRGVWRTLTLADGTEVKAQLMGDENVHYWMSENGDCYLENGERYNKVSANQLQAKVVRRVAKRAATGVSQRRRAQMGERRVLTGQKKGLVILAEFTDVKFKAANGLDRYKRVLNEEGYTTSEGFVGSVADYFKAQSGGVFELTFDVVGPVTLKNNQRYYGENDSDGNDKRPEEMIVEACKLVDEEINFADYDWDGDGEVDQVFVLYAGKGENDGGGKNTVWPHEYELSYTYKQLTLDGVLIDTYGCSNETDAYGKINGIGTFCHEFSHCMGFPDFYDILYKGSFGMSEFDLMDHGAYNGDSFVPAGYSAYEKMMVGWVDPVVLSSDDVAVDQLLPTSMGGRAYIIYNEGHPDEYYLLENRQKTGWDAELPDEGLMIMHVDFDQDVWDNNIPNTIVTNAEAREYGFTKGNQHQRMTIFHADDDDDSKYWRASYGDYSMTTLSTDLYPNGSNDSLTATSVPAATLYNANVDGNKLMGKAVTDIRQNDDGTMAFNFRAVDNGTSGGPGIVLPEGMFFYESFDKCDGTGGNDGLWSGSIASKAFKPDNEGWEYLAAFSADGCARFGTTTKLGEVTTPSFFLKDGKALLTFKAGAWKKDSGELQLSVVGNATIEPSTMTLGESAWSDFSATISGSGAVRVTFTPFKRFFLDEVMVLSTSADGIENHRAEPAVRSNAVYTLDGRYVGTDASRLEPGLYIIGGRKVVK